MAKKNKKKKTGAGMEKTMQKNAKKADKELKRAMRTGDADDIDALLDEFKSADAARTAVSIEASSGPTPRCNGTLVVHPLKDELIVYGGEAYNGQKVVTFGDLFVYNISKKEYKCIASPNSPPPRNSHQAAAVPMRGGEMWVFGGEFTSPKQQFRHYNDLWVLHLGNMSWEQVAAKHAPSPRSGHRMVEYKGKLFVFGGFFDSGVSIKYLDDLHVFDLTTMKWTQVKKPQLLSGDASWPSARSGFAFNVHEPTGTAWLYGGFCTSLADAPLAAAAAAKQNVKGSKGDSSAKSKKPTESGPLSDVWSLDLENFIWCRQKRSQAVHASTVMTTDSIKNNYDLPASKNPCQRAGTSMTVLKDNLIMFGGVSDVEDTPTDIKSVHHNDVYLFSVARKQWTLAVPPQVVSVSMSEAASAAASAENKQQISAPHPRRNAMIAAKKTSVYVLGGVYEAGKDKEVYFNDLFVADVRKLQSSADGVSKSNATDKSAKVEEDVDAEQSKAASDDKTDSVWSCLVPMDFSAFPWLGADQEEEEDEDDDDEDDDNEDGAHEEDLDDLEEEDEEDADAAEEEDGSDSDEEAPALVGEEKKDDTTPTPKDQEKLADFFDRTKDHWMKVAGDKLPADAAAAGDANAENEKEKTKRLKRRRKELRKIAFAMAQDTFESA